MPKMVDHAKRRQELAKAAFDAVARYQTVDVALAKVAKEAGWSTGALNHYVRSKDHLFSMIAEHTTALQIAAFGYIQERYKGVAKLRHILYDQLPSDEQRSTMWIIWFGFCERSKTSPKMREIVDMRNTGLLKYFSDLIKETQESGEVTKDVDAHRMARSALALLEGIGAQAHISNQKMSPRLQKQLIDDWVSNMLRSPKQSASGPSNKRT